MFVCFISIYRAVARWQFPVDRQLRPSLSSEVNFLIFFQSELLLFFQSGLFTFFQSEHSLFQSLYLSKTKWLMRWDVFTSVQVSGYILWEIGSIKWLEDTLNNWKRQCIYKRWSELEWCDLELFGGWEQIISNQEQATGVYINGDKWDRTLSSREVIDRVCLEAISNSFRKSEWGISEQLVRKESTSGDIILTFQ